jgi:hypothetical protein
VAQIKDEIRYMSRSDKIEIYRSLDGELAAISQGSDRVGQSQSAKEIERTWKMDGKDLSSRV